MLVWNSKNNFKEGNLWIYLSRSWSCFLEDILLWKYEKNKRLKSLKKCYIEIELYYVILNVGFEDIYGEVWFF